jgi:hypothetical protein
MLQLGTRLMLFELNISDLVEMSGDLPQSLLHTGNRSILSIKKCTLRLLTSHEVFDSVASCAFC